MRHSLVFMLSIKLFWTGQLKSDAYLQRRGLLSKAWATIKGVGYYQRRGLLSKAWATIKGVGYYQRRGLLSKAWATIKGVGYYQRRGLLSKAWATIKGVGYYQRRGLLSKAWATIKAQSSNWRAEIIAEEVLVLAYIRRMLMRPPWGRHSKTSLWDWWRSLRCDTRVIAPRQR